MDGEIKLSIVIPTYNGSATIGETLDSIVPQIEEGVEVVISDNASTDNTPEIVKQYETRSDNIRYYRNSGNIGGDRNFDMGVRRSRGDYVWFICDDDKILAGGIRKVLDVILNHQNLALMFVNCSVWNRDFTKCYEERSLPRDNDILYDNADDYFQLIGAWAGIYPTMVVNRRLWIETGNTPFDDTGWGVFCRLFYMLPGRSAYVISTPYALFRDGSSRHHKDGAFYEMLICLVRLINTLPDKGYSITTHRKLLSNILRHLPRTIAGEKVQGLELTHSLVNDSISVFGKYISFWLFGFPMLFVPNNVYCLVLRVYRTVRSVYHRL